MRVIFLTLTFSVASFFSDQEKPIDQWIQKIVGEMIEMNDLGKYSHKEIPTGITVDFVLVASVKDIKIENGIIKMLVNHGTGKYCSELKLRYLEKDGNFYLVFDEPITKTILGKERKFISPWIEKNNLCE